MEQCLARLTVIMIACPAALVVNKVYEGSNPSWLAHLDAASAVGARFNNVSGIQPNDTALNYFKR